MDRVKMTELPKPSSDVTEIIEWAIGATVFCINWIYFVGKYFKSKAEEKKEFIENVVIAAVKATLTSELQGIKDDVKVLFKYREDDRTHSDNQFKELMKEIKK